MSARMLAAFAAAALLPFPAAAQSPEAIRARVEQLHDAPATAIAGVRLKRPDAVAHFFESRDFKPAWPRDAISREIVVAIRGIDADGLNPADYHLAAIEALVAGRKAAPDEDLQLLVSDAVAALLDEVNHGKVRPQSLDSRWNVDPRKGTSPLDGSIARVAAAPTAATIEALKPGHFIYKGLRGALARYREITARGGWPVVPPGPPIKPGAPAADKRIATIRARLAASGDLPDANVAGDDYDAALQAAVKKFQERHRLAPDGVVGRTTIEEMNVTAAARADQIRVNLERVRWVMAGEVDSFILVNLPAFKVYVIKDHQNVWEGRTMIGKNARQTPSFRADMRYLVFNPDWTVPPTILAQDVLAGMRKGENTIARKNLMILDRQGRVVSPDSIDWQTVQARSFPYTLRQAPGPDNALGRVKFIFPNEHSIFLHDTPHREGFSSDLRTFSSGCIRLENPLELAAALLAGQDDWTPEKIERVVDAGKSQTVFLAQSMPVLLVYWTVSVGISGDVHFARDVYGRDAPLLRGLNR